MDFEFDTLSEDVHIATHDKFADSSRAVEHFDDAWYIKATRRARRMDLIGDYAGTELFIIDGMFLELSFPEKSLLTKDRTGDSLLQEVLNDSLLAIARDNGKATATSKKLF